jgi:hypothetical protein
MSKVILERTLERALERDAALFARQSLCRVVQELGAQGWCQGTGGTLGQELYREGANSLRSAASGSHKVKGWSGNASNS